MSQVGGITPEITKSGGRLKIPQTQCAYLPTWKKCQHVHFRVRPRSARAYRKAAKRRAQSGKPKRKRRRRRSSGSGIRIFRRRAARPKSSARRYRRRRSRPKSRGSKRRSGSPHKKCKVKSGWQCMHIHQKAGRHQTYKGSTKGSRRRKRRK